MYVYVFGYGCVHMRVGGCLQRPRASDAPRAGHQVIVSLCCGYWGLGSGVVQELSVLSSTCLSPQPEPWYLELHYCFEVYIYG